MDVASIPPALRGARIPKFFQSRFVWAACLYLLYAFLIVFPSWKWAAAFLTAGAISSVGRLAGIWDRLRPKGAQDPGVHPGLPALASDLAFLFALQQGFIQAEVESGRGNVLGMIICLIFVTPLLALLTRTLVLEAGKKLAAKRWKSGNETSRIFLDRKFTASKEDSGRFDS